MGFNQSLKSRSIIVATNSELFINVFGLHQKDILRFFGLYQSLQVNRRRIFRYSNDARDADMSTFEYTELARFLDDPNLELALSDFGQHHRSEKSDVFK